MFSMRLLARSSSRALTRTSIRSSRQVTTPFRLPTTQNIWRQPTTTSLVSAFSTSSRHFQVGNEELLAKLRSEIQLEKEATDTEAYNEGIKEFLSTSEFEIHDKAGEEEVVLTKKFNDENIRITFSIADINNVQPAEERYDEDNALYDEEGMDSQDYAADRSNKGAINSSARTGAPAVAPEDRLAPADREDLEEDFEGDGQDVTFPCRVNIQVTRDGKPGALDIAAVADSGDLVIENVAYFPSADAADSQRDALYTGPPFGNLDVELQTMMEKYLEERGIGIQLAMFVPEYVDFKEQKEYVRWLENVESFLQ